MPDAARLLADLGAASMPAVWLPILAWTAVAVAAELALRAVDASARIGLSVRGALLALLPALVVLPPAMAGWVPSLRLAPPAVVIDATLPMTEAGAVPLDGTRAAIPVADVAAPVPLLDLALGLAVLIAIVAAVLAVGVLIGGLWWLRRYRRELAAAAAPVAVEARALADRLGVRGPLDVALAEPASAPFTVGWRRPVVAVPPDLTGEALRLALAHELAHVREAHYGWSLAERAVRAVFVWHPLVHVLGRGLALDRERAADAAVLRLWPEQAQRYGRLLHAFASRPSPGLALGASSSTLLHRLDAMTRLRPDRRRLAVLAGTLVLALPLLLAASAVPDAPPPDAFAVAESPTLPPRAEAASDTLDAYVASRRLRASGQGHRLVIDLVPGTPRSVAVDIADYYAAGDEAGELVVSFDGETITRSTLRADAIPPPPPPPPAPPAAPEAPEPPPAALASAPEPPPAAPPAPPTPPAPPAPPEPPSLAVIERATETLREELLAVERELSSLDAWEADDSPEEKTRRMELGIRRDVIQSRYQTYVALLERARIDHLLSEADDGR